MAVFKEEVIFTIGEYGQEAPILKATRMRSDHLIANSVRKLFLCGKLSYRLLMKNKETTNQTNSQLTKDTVQGSALYRIT